MNPLKLLCLLSLGGCSLLFRFEPAPFCGDGTPDPATEACDDGNNADNDGCDGACALESCGDGTIQDDPNRPEECDDGNLIDGDGCDSNCTATACGNGISTSGEECDDGNLTDGDGCDDACVGEFCGDGRVNNNPDPNNPNEECDDENNIDNDGCTNACRNAVCGDGIVFDQNGGLEECDDANNIETDGCHSDCELPACGDGIVDPGLLCFEPVPTISLGSVDLGINVLTIARSGTMASGDFDRDGFLDLVVVVPGTAANGVTVLFGNGLGGFDVRSRNLDEGPAFVTTADFTGDSILDLAISRPNSSFLQGDIVLMVGTGLRGGNIFGIDTVIEAGSLGGSVPTAISHVDVDDDGDEDIVAAISGSLTNDSLKVIINSGFINENITVATNRANIPYGENTNPIFLTIADIDNNAGIDFITANPGLGNVALFLSQNNLNFITEDVDLGEAVSAEVADFSGDGTPDLAFTQAGDANTNSSIVINIENQNTVLTVPPGAFKLASDDFDNDGDIDLVSSIFRPNGINAIILKNLGDGTFNEADIFFLGDDDEANDLLLGDFNGDTLNDIAVLNSTSATISVYLANP